MMKEPIFRGFNKETNKWHNGFGFYINRYTEKYKEENGVQDDATLFTEVSPIVVELESVGQYATTVKDVNLKQVKLFDGDVIRFRYQGDWNEWSKPLLVEWGGDEYPAFDLKGHSCDCNLLSLIVSSGEYEVELLGNVFEKPQLIQ